MVIEISYPFSFRWSAKVEASFEENRIFLVNPFKIKGIYKLNQLVSIPGTVMVEPYSAMSGKRGFVSAGLFSYSHSPLAHKATIGRYCSIAPGVKIMGPEHPTQTLSTHPFTCRGYVNAFLKDEFGAEIGWTKYNGTYRGRVIIENDVWIASNVTLRPGVRIGNGAIVAGSSVVVKDVPPYAIVGGNPAQIIRYRFDKYLIDRLLKSEWWDYNVSDFSGLDIQDPNMFLDEFDLATSEKRLVKHPEKRINLATMIYSVIKDE
jgi:acetyltransferase-like isoleucine patch superfamily enzyme